jgi:hypothetical protein
MKWKTGWIAVLASFVVAGSTTAQFTLLNSASTPPATFQSTIGTAHTIDTTNLKIGPASLARTNAASSGSYLPTAIPLAPAAGFTIQWWFRPSGIDGLGTAKYLFGDPGMLSPVGGASGGAFRCFHDGVAGVGGLIIRGVPNQAITGLGVITNGTWTHVALRYNPATNTINWLINGVVNASAVQPVAFNWTGVNLSIFGYAGGGANIGAPGNVDDFRIYGWARTDADILADMNVAASGLGPSGMSNVPDLAYYQVDGSVQAHTAVIGSNGDAPSAFDRKITAGTLLSWGGNCVGLPGTPASCLINLFPTGVNPGFVTPGTSLISLGHAFSIPTGSALIFPDGIDLNSLGVGAGIPGPYTYGGPAGPTLVSLGVPPILGGALVAFQFVGIDPAYPLGVGASNVLKAKYVDAIPGAHAHVECRGVGAIQQTGSWEFHNTGTVDITQVKVDAVTATGGATGFTPGGALNSGGTLLAGTSYRFGTAAITGLTGPAPGLFTPIGTTGLQFDFTNFSATIDELVWDCESIPANAPGNVYIGSTVTVTFADTTVLTGTLIADPLDGTAAVIDL